MRTRIVIATLLLTASAALAAGEGAPATPTPVPAGSTTRPATKATPGGLSEEQMAELIRQARPRLLAQERRAVAREIEDGPYDLDLINQAVTSLQATPADTPTDNIERILRAFALVDARLAGPAEKLAAGQYAAAAEAAEAIIDPGGTGYIDAAKRMLRARALLALGREEEIYRDQAIEALGEIIATTPEKVSFAAMAALRGAETYEQMHRMLHASRTYDWWLENYGFLDPDRATALKAKIDRIRADYKDPLVTVAKKMDAVEKRLAAADSGRQTQTTEREIVAMLDDLIASAEESGGGCGGGGGDGQQPGAGAGAGGKPSGNTNSSNPAEVSALPTGAAPKSKGLSSVHPNDRSDAWGRLPARQREALINMLKQKYPERYMEMIEKYYRALAEDNR